MTRQQVIDFLADHYGNIKHEAAGGSALAQRVVNGLIEMTDGVLSHDQYHEIVERYAAADGAEPGERA